LQRENRLLEQESKSHENRQPAAVAEMDMVTQQNAALVEEAAAAAESPQSQATELAEAVSVFKLDTVARPARGVARCWP
jgi:methyl-accepting chemotaxis protein